MNLDAILRIGAKVTGTEQVAQLQGKLKTVEGAAKSLTTQGGLLGGALGALAPVATIGGLGALIGKTIETGDALNDMSQKTGVSVEALAKFKKAAEVSGTDIEGVSRSLVKLDKGLFGIGSNGDKVGPALDRLGISAKDAAGKLKSADQVTLEIADRFKTMPDGPKKTATALDLFGKAGADMVPLLNMGGQAIDSLSVKMSTAFAKKADDYNDKLTMLTGKVGGLAAGLTVALLPALDLIATGLTVVVDAFGRLPGPIQAVIGGAALLAISLTALSPILASLVTVAAAFEGLALGATIAGWLGAIGPLITTVGAFVAGVVGWPLLIGGALVAIGALIYNFRGQIGEALTGIGKAVYGAADGANKAIKTGIGAAWDWLKGRFDALTGWIDGLVQTAGRMLGGLGDAIRAPFVQAAESIRGVLNTIVGAIVGAVNGVVAQVNRAIQAANGMAASLRLPQLPTLPVLSVPQFAQGAYVTGPTLAQFGEAEPEYAIPASKMASASAAYLAGARGAAVLQAAASPSASSAAPSIAISIQTGQVVQLPDGRQAVSMADLERAMHATAAGIMQAISSPAGRVALGGA